MIIRMLCLIVIASTLGFAQQEAAREYRRCAGCHGVPDIRVAGDDVWIGRVATTACVQPPAPKGKAKRQALIDFLSSEHDHRPQLVAKAASPKKGDGLVTAPFEEGSILLVGAERGSTPVRLAWKKGERGEAALRSIPAGKYRVRGYRHLLTDENGVTWQLWGSGQRGRAVEVVAGKKTRIALDLRVHVKTTSQVRGDHLQVGVVPTGDHGMGVTIVKAQDRIPATARVGKRIVSLAYG